MANYGRVVIAGVGLLGGSIGKCLKARRLADEVIGVGRSTEKLQLAQQLGAVDRYTLELAEACSEAAIVVVCTPVQYIARQAASCCAAIPSGGLVTDVGSTKQSICQALSALEEVDLAAREVSPSPSPSPSPSQQPGSPRYDRFCGSHPLAGSDKSGVQFAHADLLVDKLTLITPTEQTDPHCADEVEAFWQSLGSRTLRMTPEDHDRAIARTSHLPHLLASALAQATPAELLPLAASGWRDTTRIAAGDVELWKQIVVENQDSILAGMKDFGLLWRHWIDVLEAGDFERLVELLEAGKQKRDSLGN